MRSQIQLMKASAWRARRDAIAGGVRVRSKTWSGSGQKSTKQSRQAWRQKGEA